MPLCPEGPEALALGVMPRGGRGYAGCRAGTGGDGGTGVSEMVVSVFLLDPRYVPHMLEF